MPDNSDNPRSFLDEEQIEAAFKTATPEELDHALTTLVRLAAATPEYRSGTTGKR